MAKKIPEFIPEKKLFAAQLNATWEAIALNTLLGLDGTTKLPKALFNIGDINEIVGGAMVNDMIARNTGKLSVYDSDGLAVGSTTWEALLSAGISLLPPGFIKGFVPEWVDGTHIKFGAGTCRDSTNTVNMNSAALDQKSLMLTWGEGFGSAIGAMVGGAAIYDYAVKMTSDSLPTGELSFCTSNTVASFNAFNKGIVSAATSAVNPTLPWYIGRKNNIGVITSLEFAPRIYNASYNQKITSFDVVGTNDVITNLTEFNAASWTVIASFDNPDFQYQDERKRFKFDNDINWYFIGIKVKTIGTIDFQTPPANSRIEIQQIVFSANTPVNEILPLKEPISETELYSTPVNYYCFILYNPISTQYDWCVDTDPNGANILSNSAITAAGYTKFRRVFAFTGNADAQVTRFKAHENINGGLSVGFVFNSITAVDGKDGIVYSYNGSGPWSVYNQYLPRSISKMVTIPFSAGSRSSDTNTGIAILSELDGPHFLTGSIYNGPFTYPSNRSSLSSGYHVYGGYSKGAVFSKEIYCTVYQSSTTVTSTIGTGEYIDLRID